MMQVTSGPPVTIASKAFTQAVTKFRNHLTPDELRIFRSTTRADLEIELKNVQRKQETQKDMHGMVRLESMLEAVTQLGNVVEVFLNVSDVVAFIWGPLKLMLHTASAYMHAFDSLLDAYQSIGEYFPLLDQYEKIMGNNPRLIRVLELLYGDILEFHRKALPFFTRPRWRQVFRSMWNDFNTRFKGILNAVQRHSRLLETQAELIHFEQDAQIIDSLERAEKDRADQSLDTVRQWLAGSSANDFHQEACRHWQEHQGTGSWILTNQQICRWRDEEFPRYCMFWLHGIPGAGKTVLSSIIVDDCQQIRNSNTIYFYCRQDDESTNGFISILKGLLLQLIHLYQDLVPYFLEKRRKSLNTSLTDESTAKDLLEVACYQNKRLYIVLDGIDECAKLTDRKTLLSFFANLVRSIDSKHPGKLRLLMVSQMEMDIQKALIGADILELRREHTVPDIANFVYQKATRLQNEFRITDHQRQYIEENVCRRAMGQFLYASLVMDNLARQATQEDLAYEMNISRLPNDLAQAYDRIVSRIRRYASPSEWEHARRVLGWIVCSVRPLKWHEIQGALSVDSSEGIVRLREMSMKSHIKEICGSLIHVHDQNRVSLVHSTARRFIIESGQVAVEVVEFDLVSLCLQYLTFPCFADDLTESELTQSIHSGQYAFQDYAIAKWEYHFRRVISHAPSLGAYKETPEQERALQEFAESVELFFLHFQSDIEGLQRETCNDRSQSSVAAIPTAAIKILDEFDADQNFLHLYQHIERFHSKQGPKTPQISLPTLQKALDHIREGMESLALTRASRQPRDSLLEEYYGSRWFKCPKVSCYNFHEGFLDSKTRKLHLDRHDRPWRCPVADCSNADFGFGSKNNLGNHIRSSHPELVDKSSSFPLQRTSVPVTSKHDCSVCGKKFARAGILKDHLLTHTGQKPHQCSVCGKAFTRKNDCDRHERTIHTQRARSTR